MDDTKESLVEYSLNGQQLQGSGTSNLFTDGGSEKRQQFIHKVQYISFSYFFFLFIQCNMLNVSLQNNIL